MTDQNAPAGWYPDGSGTTRWWDGSTWTEEVQVETGEMPTSTAEAVPAVAARSIVKADKSPFYSQKWFVGFAAGVVGILLGAAAMATSDVKDSPEYKSLAGTSSSYKQDRDDAIAERDALTDEMEPLKAQVAEVDSREATLDDREDEIASREDDVSAAAKAVKKREKAVGIVETEIKNNTIDGDGIYAVGDDIAAGTYKTKGGADCYYAVLRDTKGGIDSIVNNNNISGAGIVTVAKGQYLELSGCAKWVKQ